MKTIELLLEPTLDSQIESSKYDEIGVEVGNRRVDGLGKDLILELNGLSIAYLRTVGGRGHEPIDPRRAKRHPLSNLRGH